MLIKILIIFFIFLISYQFILANNPLIEGAQNYKDYPEDALVLSKQNAGNIEFLKERVDKLITIGPRVDKLEKTMDTLEKQMNEMAIESKKMGEELSNPIVPTE